MAFRAAIGPTPAVLHLAGLETHPSKVFPGDEILELDTRAWEQRAGQIEEEDRKISEEFVAQGLSHYAIKYNRFMGVISDYFTAED